VERRDGRTYQTWGSCDNSRPCAAAAAKVQLKVLVAPFLIVTALLVATAHGLSGLWQQAEAQPIEAYPGSSKDSKLCAAASASCEVCTSKTKANGASCRWFAEDRACMAEGGSGGTVCLQPESTNQHAEGKEGGKCPANCKLYFDGCNDCHCFPDGMGCTEMDCVPGKTARPYCKEENWGGGAPIRYQPAYDSQIRLSEPIPSEI